MHAVVETYGLSEFTQWPIAPVQGNLRLSGSLSNDLVGTAVAAIADYGGEDDDPDGETLLRRLLSAEMIIAPGGVRVMDTVSGVVVEPGCCFGLEDWRAWYDVLEGKPIWHGHSPEPSVVIENGIMRIRPNDETGRPFCEIPCDALGGLLAGVQRDLVDFLGLVRKWAPNGLGDQLATVLDKHFRINAE